MEIRPGQELRVGLLLVIAIGLLVAAYYITGSLWRRPEPSYFIHFDNAGGLKQGDTVRMAGINIGEVARVSLDTPSGALVEIRVRPDVGGRPVFLYDRYSYRVATGVLLQESALQIVQRKPRGRLLKVGDKITGESAVAVEDIVPILKQTADNLQQITAQVRDIVGTGELGATLHAVGENLRVASANAAKFTSALAEVARTSSGPLAATAYNLQQASIQVRRASEQAAALAGDPGLQGAFRETLASLERSSHNVEQLTANPALKQSLDNLARTAEQLAASSEALAQFVSKPANAANVEEALAALRAAADNVETTTAHLRQVLTDAGLSQDLRQSLRNIADASQQAKESVAKADAILSAGQRLASSVSRLEAHAVQDVYYSGKSDDWQGALNIEVTTGPKGRSFTAGAEDIGQGNRLNLKIGRDLTPWLGARGGLHRGQMGLGLVASPAPGLSLSLDLYNPKELAADFWARYDLAQGLSLALGQEHIFRGNYPRAGLTLRY
jgi:phospholipid/cholesterol/gamma-HCH transport system substrate-binding protein